MERRKSLQKNNKINAKTKQNRKPGSLTSVQNFNDNNSLNS
jgi:hypothetical protein